MRLFVALDLPREVREALGALPLGEGWRRVPVESLHVTLAFLGDLESATPVVDSVRSALRPVGRLSLGEAVCLPPRRPRVMAVRLRGDLGEMQAAVAGALVAAGLYEPETRPFLAHVTIGRARDRPSRELPAVPSLSFAAPSVSVYASHLSPKGARHEALATFPVVTVASDPEELRAVRLAALADTPAAFQMTLEEEAAKPAAWWEDLAARSAAGATDRVFVAGGGAGMAAGRWQDDYVHLWGMWVAPAARGTGVGRALVAAVVDWARSTGAARVLLSVLDGVPRAADVYAAAGFVHAGHRDAQTHFELRLR